MMKNRKLILTLMILAFGILFVEFGSAQNSNTRGTASFTNYGGGFNRYYASEGRLQTYWPILSEANRESCVPTQDLIIQVSPGGCQPMVVRSDLLAEQNVPVFCQLDALTLNPAVNIKQIRNIRFRGNYPPEVAGVGFHPARAALRTRENLLGSPLTSNIGYVVIVLKRQPNERNLTEVLNFTLQASVDYYSGNAIGIGSREFLLSETSDDEWAVERNKQSFFKGLYSLRLRDVEPNTAIVDIYQGDARFTSTRLERGRATGDIYLPSSYCQTALNLKFDEFVSADKIARLQIDDDVIEVYQGSRFLNGKCAVRKIVYNETGSSVEISCQNEKFTLGYKGKELKVGDEVYLVEDKTFIINKDKVWKIEKVNRGSKGKVDSYDLNNSVNEAEKNKGVKLSFVVPVSNEGGLYEAEYPDGDEYFKKAIESYEYVADNYPNEKADAVGGTHGEKALENAIRLALRFNKQATAGRLINKYFEIYPDVDSDNNVRKTLTKEFREKLVNLGNIDSSLASHVVEIDNEVKVIVLKEIFETSKKSSATLAWKGISITINEGDTIDFGILGKVSLNKVVDAERVEVTTHCPNKGNDVGKEDKETLRLDETGYSPCEGTLVLTSIDLKKFAKVSLSPRVRTGADVNVSVGVGIEKRAFELSPSKARKKIDNLNKTIEKWETISSALGNVVKGLKAACFATSAVLTVKNFFTGLSGEAMARQEVMRGDDGWTKWCADQVSAGKYSTINVCYNEKAPEINEDVEARARAIRTLNSKMEAIEKPHTNSEGGIFGGESLDVDKAKTKLKEDIERECRSVGTGLTGGQGTVGGLLESAKEKQLSYEQLRDIYYNCLLSKESGLSDRGRAVWTSDLNRISTTISERLKIEEDKETTKDLLKDIGLTKTIPYVGTSARTSRVVPYYGDKISGATGNLANENNKLATYLVHNQERYLVILKDETGGKYSAESVYKFEEKIFTKLETIPEDIKNTYTYERREALDYNNGFATGQSDVRYFESEPYKGMPSIVPFDFTRGFYAATKQTLPLLGNLKSFESNGRPSSFWVCNVMGNKKIDFYDSDFGDDECVQFNVNTGQAFSNFPGLSEQETRNIVSRAIRALQDAADQYKTGVKQVKIERQTLNVGNPAAIIPGTQCQDYMSPEDCKILFNVCDPVICPASRCDFGGKYRVADVFQTGIVGSALLCLPNFREGIIMPVCLTGIKAGIDGYLSLLKSHQQCLQENIDSGRYVGICDQITSVYMCEFFWKQAAPLANVLLPKFVELAAGGGGVRGGGEYLTVQNAWDNAAGSMDYFTQNYAANSIQAFRLRSIESAGTEFCRGFLSFASPESFEALVEPDSPVQFHAWFSSMRFSDATVPATAQYKVFYHIFAGQDAGVSYQVYLRNPPESVYYTTQTVVVASGFIPKGDFATETKDFTAPEGYQELCVNVNNKEECGFKSVSTSFALNYVKDEIVADELKRTDIASESECVSGSASPAAFLNPNLQAGVEEAIDPAIYNRGIVRVCATSNPGIGTNPTRYVNVGNCGDERIGCWLDKESVGNALSSANLNATGNTLGELTEIQKKNFAQDGDFLQNSQLEAEIDGLKGKIGAVTKVSIAGLIFDIEDILDKTFWNEQRARLWGLKGEAYNNVFLKVVGLTGTMVGAAGSATTNQEVVGVENKNGEGENRGSSGGGETNRGDNTPPYLLSLDGGYDVSKDSRFYFKLDDVETIIYIQKLTVLMKNPDSLKRDILVGTVSNGKVNFLLNHKDKIESVFGKDSFALINEKNIDNLKRGIPLTVPQATSVSS